MESGGVARNFGKGVAEDELLVTRSVISGVLLVL